MMSLYLYRRDPQKSHLSNRRPLVGWKLRWGRVRDKLNAFFFMYSVVNYPYDCWGGKRIECLGE